MSWNVPQKECNALEVRRLFGSSYLGPRRGGINVYGRMSEEQQDLERNGICLRGMDQRNHNLQTTAWGHRCGVRCMSVGIHALSHLALV